MLLYLMKTGVNNDYIFDFMNEEDMIKLYQHFNKGLYLTSAENRYNTLLLLVGIEEELEEDVFYDIDNEVLFSFRDVSDIYNEGSIGLSLDVRTILNQ